MKFALHPPIPSNIPPRTSNLSLFISLRTLSHSSPVTPLFATLTQINPGVEGGTLLPNALRRDSCLRLLPFHLLPLPPSPPLPPFFPLPCFLALTGIRFLWFQR